MNSAKNFNSSTKKLLTAMTLSISVLLLFFTTSIHTTLAAPKPAQVNTKPHNALTLQQKMNAIRADKLKLQKEFRRNKKLTLKEIRNIRNELAQLQSYKKENGQITKKQTEYQAVLNKKLLMTRKTYFQMKKMTRTQYAKLAKELTTLKAQASTVASSDSGLNSKSKQKSMSSKKLKTASNPNETLKSKKKLEKPTIINKPADQKASRSKDSENF